MRKLLILFLSAFAVQSNAQVAFELPAMNVVYIGLANPLNVVAEGVAREKLRFAFSGSCHVIDSVGCFYLYCSKRGEVAVWVLNDKGDTLDNRVFRVRSIPKPEAVLGTLESGTHSIGAIMAQPGLYAALGEGFAYEGVRFLVDSALVRIETLNQTLVCRQAGRRFDHRIRSAMKEEVSRIYVDEIYVSRPGTSEPILLNPLEIKNRDFIIQPHFYPKVQEQIIKPELGACIIWSYDSVTFMKEGSHHLILREEVSLIQPANVLHMVDGDTFVYQEDGNFKSFYPGNYLKESGIVKNVNDSLFGVSIQGKFNKSWYKSGFEPGIYNIDSEIDRRTYPVGEWKYYHPNGQLKAQGSYKIYKVTREWDSDHVAPNTLIIYRTGTWKFYDEEGNLVEKVKYK